MVGAYDRINGARQKLDEPRRGALQALPSGHGTTPSGLHTGVAQ
jgi:hypothetical protein